jgi:hypothetical protein
MNQIPVRPHKYKQFGQTHGTTFCLVTNSALINNFAIEENDSYDSYKVIAYDKGDNFEEILQNQIPEPAHILVISPKNLFESPSPEKLGQRRKLAALACNSTLTSLEAVSHFMKAMEQTNPNEQEAFAERFFTIAGGSSQLRIIDEFYNTTATFEHLNKSYEWFKQAGLMGWGGQQIVPSGELSVLPLAHGKYNENQRLAVNGEVALKGKPILHSGKPSFLLKDQQRIYTKLSCIDKHALVAKVKDGVVTDIYATNPTVKPAAEMLKAMFEVDSRYRIIWEIGFGINTQLEMLPGNLGMNEVYGGQYGSIHWGLGLTPWTQYHLDIICPDTKVLSDTGEIIIGSHITQSDKSKSKIVYNKVAGCPCQSY